MKYSKADLQDLLKEIGKLTGYATSYNEAQENKTGEYLELDHYSQYGGYKLVLIKPSTASCGVFGKTGTEARVSANMMGARMQGIVEGLTFNREQ